MANYVDDDCEKEKNKNITNMTDFLSFQLKKSQSPETKSLLSELNNKNWSMNVLEKKLLQDLEQQLEIKDIFNIELKKATEFLNSIKPNYKSILSEYKDFFASI